MTALPQEQRARATFEALQKVWWLVRVTSYTQGPKPKPEELELVAFTITGAQRKQKWVAVPGSELFERIS